MKNTLLSLGHGYSAQALTHALSSCSQSWDIFGTTRSQHKVAPLKGTNITPILWPSQQHLINEALNTATHLLISAAPDEHGDTFYNALHERISKRHQERPFTWVGYLSTTGVYGDHQGAWVDENTPLTPSTQRGQYRVKAEAAWQSIQGLPLHIFRLAGIYGPGRGPFSKVRSGKARRIIKDNQVFSRIHVEDIAQVLNASIQAPHNNAHKSAAIYNVCDNMPAPPQDVIAYAAQLLNMPIPPDESFENVTMSPMATSFYAESKRVSNAKIKNELGVKLKYPDYQTGLQALLRGA